MASVYKRTHVSKSGRKSEARRYTVEVKIGDGFRRLSGFTDVKASEELGRKVERLDALRATGEQPDAGLRAFLDGLPSKIRQRLAKFGLVDARTLASRAPLVTHLDEYKQALKDRGATATHAELTYNRVKAILDGTGATTIRELTAAAVSRYLAGRRAKDRSEHGLSIKSSNHYLASAKAFCNWMVENGRAHENPLTGVAKLNAATDRRHMRRSLEAGEIARLLAVTAKAEPSFDMTGTERSLLYRLAVETGLRSNELRSLTRASFDLNPDHPTVTVEAMHAKNRTAATLPLRPETAALLRTFLAGKLPAATLFRLPRPEKIVFMFRADLKAAGIRYRDDATDRVADFHSLRVTFASFLLRSGVDVRTAKELMRHSSITLTADVYACTLRGSLDDAIARLPSFTGLQAASAAATGTDGPAGSQAGESAGREGAEKTGGQIGGNAARFGHIQGREVPSEPARPRGPRHAKLIGKNAGFRGLPRENRGSEVDTEKTLPTGLEPVS